MGTQSWQIQLVNTDSIKTYGEFLATRGIMSDEQNETVINADNVNI